AVILFFMPEDLRPGTMTDDETGKTVDSCNERHCGVAVRLVKNAPATATTTKTTTKTTSTTTKK
ncbi:MAG: hypothetical protein J6Y82_11460, partial [Bacteroidales bacterium]|nr:hypothetical protein [Bacteroidales bacterium]